MLAKRVYHTDAKWMYIISPMAIYHLKYCQSKDRGQSHVFFDPGGQSSDFLLIKKLRFVKTFRSVYSFSNLIISSTRQSKT